MLALLAASQVTTFSAADKATNSAPKPLASWTPQGIDYVWDADHVRDEYLASGAFQRNYNNMAGIKIKPGSTPQATTVYISVPRWFPGVPSTLNEITLDLTKDDTPIDLPLKPYPSWQANDIGGDCSGLQYVQSMEIDNEGFMWIIDTGRINIFHESVDNSCPPKLVVIDTATGEMVDEPYIFPDQVAAHNSTHLNDLVIDNVNQMAYITDSSANAGLIVYDRTNRRSRRFESPTMYPNGMGGAPDPDVDWTINNNTLGSSWPGAGVPMDGIALTPDNTRIYYTTLGGLDVYSLDSAVARDFDATDDEYTTDLEASINMLGNKVDATDGMAFTCDGELVYGALTQASVYTWAASQDNSSDPAVDSILKASDDENMHWVDTFGFNNVDGSLWFTVNFLHELFTTGNAGPAHLFKIPTAGSYQKGVCAMNGDGGSSPIITATPTEAATSTPTMVATETPSSGGQMSRTMAVTTLVATGLVAIVPAIF